MEQAQKLPGSRWPRVLISTLLMLAVQIGALAILRKIDATASGELAASVLGAIVVLAIGAINVGSTPYPRWAFRAMVGIMAAGMVLTPLSANVEGSWDLASRGDLWMMPWFLITLGTLRSAPRSVCMSQSRTMGWFMVGITVVLVLVCRLDTWIALLSRAGGFSKGAI